MIIKARINQNKVYNLVRWNALDFNANLTLIIQSVDLVDIRNTFEHVDKLEILQDDILIATYTSLDTYSQITYLGKEYVEGEKTFSDAMSVTLTKTDIVDQVQRLDEQINPVVDPTTMGLAEYKLYKISKIHEDVENDIYRGTQVVMSDNTVETFTFTVVDQLDITNLWNVIVSSGGKVISLPYHSHGNECRMYDVRSIVNLYIEMQKCITEKTTIANFTIMKVREATTKSELDNIYYGMELDSETSAKIETILSATMNVINIIIEQIDDMFPPAQEPKLGSDEDELNNE